MNNLGLFRLHCNGIDQIIKLLQEIFVSVIIFYVLIFNIMDKKSLKKPKKTVMVLRIVTQYYFSLHF